MIYFFIIFCKFIQIPATICTLTTSYLIVFSKKFFFSNYNLVFMNKIYAVVFIIFSLLFINRIAAQNETEFSKAQKYLNKKGEVYFRFNIETKETLSILTSIISLDNVKNKEVYAYANRREFDKFLQQDIDYEVLPHPGDAEAEMYDNSKGIWQFDTYPTYSEYETMMNTFATNYPNLCRLDTIATLSSGRRLLVIKITDNPDIHEFEPEILYTGTMHGDETTGYVLLLRLINYMLTNHGVIPKITNIVNNTELWICPLANPDGTYAGGNNTVSGATRYNANFVDLNRNYPDPRAGQNPDGNSWQPETVAWMNFADEHDFVLAANMHGGASVFNYPWDTWTSAQRMPADNSWWVYTGNEFADTAQFYGPAGYFTDVTSSGVTEGGDWYIITGGRQDYMNYFKHCREVTLELSVSKLLAAAQLPNYWNYLYRSFLNNIEQAMYGVKGIITDDCTGQPVKALVTVNSHDADSTQVYSSLPVGNYHRPIYAGTWSFSYSANGYQTQTITGITVSNMATAIRNVQLTPLPPVADFSSDVTSGCNPVIQFSNTSQTPSGSTYFWDFGDGQTSTLENPAHTYAQSGSFTVTLTVTNSCSGTDQVVKPSFINLTLPEAPVTTSAESCGPSSLSLSASGTGTLNWFDAPTGGALINTGTSYTTPLLSATTTYYVENLVSSASQYVGNTQSSSNGSIFTASNEHYLIFNSLTDCKIVSVEVNASTAGDRTIQLRNSSNNVLQTATVYIPAGVSRITLNFDVPVGTNLRLVGPGSPNLYRNNAGVSFPYSLPGLISITNSDAGTNYYYYFYDWEVMEAGCSSARTPVTATIKPVPTANAGNDVTLCYGDAAALAATGGGNYLWSTGATTASVNVSPSATTIYYVTVTNTEGCTDADNVLVTVLPLLTVDAGNDQIIPPGSSTSLSGSASGGSGNYSYSWQPAGLVNNPAIASPVTSTLTSSTQFILNVIDDNGCTSSDTVIIFIQGTNLTASATASPQVFCEGLSTQLNASASGGSGNYTYYWESSPPGFTSSLENPLASPAATTTYYVTVNDGFSDFVSSVNVTVNPQPVSNFTYVTDMLNIYFTNTSLYANSNMWYFGDGGLSTQVNPNYNYFSDGTYNVTLITTNGCGSDTLVQQVTVSSISIVDNKNDKERFAVFPNPSRGIVFFSGNTGKIRSATVSDISGRILLHSTDVSTLKSIDLSGLSDGMYYISVYSEYGTEVLGIVKY